MQLKRVLPIAFLSSKTYETTISEDLFAILNSLRTDELIFIDL